MNSKITAAIVATLFFIGGCGDDSAVLRLATTTSIRDSGLLEALTPKFEKQYDVRLDVIAVGTGKAIKLGEFGEVEAILVHAADAEKEFVAANHGVRREEVMYNTFELVGPSDDPAGIKAMNVVPALQQIARRGIRFISRADRSGTHMRELSLWDSGGGKPQWDNYIEAGQGMGKTLMMADQLGGYTLADRGTYLRFKAKILLRPLIAPSDEMLNPYGVLVINPDKLPTSDNQLAHAFADFMISHEVQSFLQEYTVEDERLFYPSRLNAQ